MKTQISDLGAGVLPVGEIEPTVAIASTYRGGVSGEVILTRVFGCTRVTRGTDGVVSIKVDPDLEGDSEGAESGVGSRGRDGEEGAANSVGGGSGDQSTGPYGCLEGSDVQVVTAASMIVNDGIMFTNKH